METGNNIDYRKTYKVGMYHYGRHRSSFGVWVCVCVTKDFASSDFVKDFDTREDARRYVWCMNGWGTPKTALAR